MPRSMTGYGKGEAVSDRGRFVVEVRTVNHRYAELSVKMPRSFMAYESDLRKVVATGIKRGKTDIFVQWEELAAETSVPPVNMAAAKGYHAAFLTIAHELRLSPEIPLALIVNQKNVLQETVSDDETDLKPQLMEAVTNAVTALDQMRCREGESLIKDLMDRRKELSQIVEQIRLRAPDVVQEYQLKLKQRLVRLLEGADLDQQRLLQEIAMMADRSDITEELVRLDSHFEQFDHIVGLAEPVGRKLDFLMQEFNREVNTIGSKANDAVITSLVVQLKAEMEKMREQIQNIE